MGALESPKISGVPEEAAQPDKHTILVADDDRDLREFYADLLTRQGYVVTTATNGKEAVISVLQSQPQLILLDIMMPVMDGFEVLMQLSLTEQTKKIPVIMLTNAGNMENMDRTKEYPVYKFFVKANLSPEDLLKAVAEVLHTPTKDQPSWKDIPG